MGRLLEGKSLERQKCDGWLTAAERRFGRYKGEEEKAVNEPDVSEDKLATHLAILWGARKLRAYPTATDISNLHNHFIEKLGELALALSPQEVERMSILLGRLENEERFAHKAGVLLSALVEKGDGDSFVIPTHHIDPPHYLGYHNTKRVTVIGDTGDRLGYCMGGKGEIIVRGDVGDELGMYMTSGKITVLGNAGDSVGLTMDGGEIHLGGGFSSIKMVLGGRIYHKGRLIVDK